MTLTPELMSVSLLDVTIHLLKIFSYLILSLHMSTHIGGSYMDHHV